MKFVFNKGKVKAWIKKAHKRASFGYGHGYITDGYALFVDEPHMHPIILELYGTLSPNCRYNVEQFQKLIKLPDEPVEVIDSRLEFVPDPKSRLRIFYDSKTGRKIAIDGIYFDLLDNPKVIKFYTNDERTILWIVYDDEVMGAVAPVVLHGTLSHIEFMVEEEEEVEQD
jgi:hypothetical protein